MKNYQSSVEYRPKTDPEVIVTLWRGTEGRRAQLQADTQHIYALEMKIGDLIRKNEADCGMPKDLLPEEKQAFLGRLSRDDPEAFDRYQERSIELMNRFRFECSEKRVPFILEHAIRSIRGITIDGKVPTGRDLYFGCQDSDLLEEISREAVRVFLGLTAEQEKNSESPTTSLAVVAPGANDSTASIASEQA